MGADGGSLAKRSDLVSRAPVRPASPGSLSADAWTLCALSGKELQDPVVSDWNGYLYNKKAILEFLLGTSSFSIAPKTDVRQIRDVAAVSREVSGGRWIDPVSQQDVVSEASSQQLAYIVECGHVGPFKVLADARANTCQVCERSYSNVVIMNPQTWEAVAKNKSRMERLEQMGLSHSLRPRKRHAKKRGLDREVEDNSEIKAAKLRRNS